MTDIESPEAFTSRLVCNAHDYDSALPLIRSRDRAVRRRPAELLASWVQLAREGAFGQAYEECVDDCDCVVCVTEGALADSEEPHG